MGSPKTRKWSNEDFDRAVKKALRRIPREIRQHLENVLISVVKRPSEEMLQDLSLSLDDLPLGLYRGVSLSERSVISPPLYPDTIFLFQDPLEEMCATLSELEEEIEITLVHEIAHALGMTEEALAELGYD